MHQKLIALENTFKPAVLNQIDDPLLARYQIELWIKRDDLMHPVISGNKWRKLKYILDHALSLNVDTLISMGGAYSNHLHALAYLGQQLELKTVGFIRGERPAVLNASLLDMQNWGMELKFVSRAEYRWLRHFKGRQDLPGQQARQYWLPEGGAQRLSLKGVAELVQEIDRPYDMICAPCGTGTTLAGMIDAVPAGVSVLGFAALKNAGFLTKDIEQLLERRGRDWEIHLNYHFGGFAKAPTQLFSFMHAFELKHIIPLEPVYTGKMLYGLYDLMAKNYFKPGQRIIAVHTGGLQGNRGFNY